MPRCKHCNKTNSFTLICKCNNEYCTTHYLPEKHGCEMMNAFKSEAYDNNKKKLNKTLEKDQPEWIIR
jgi:predicted nucleic acid binding AN1-type Zn finger protein